MELPSPQSDARGTPAPYGQACEACSKSKCKCMILPGARACERCLRLNKPCHPASNKRKRADGSSAGKHVKLDEAVGMTKQLERRLEALEANVQRQQSLLGAMEPSATIQPATETNSITYGRISVPALLRSEPDKDTTHQAAEQRDIWASARITPHESEARLEVFRTTYLKWAPFIHLPAAISSSQLYQSRPLLWLSIMFTCGKDDHEIRRLDKLFREIVAEEMVVKSRKSIDLLLGLLVFITWYHHHCRNENGNVRMSLSLMVQMSISLVNDLKRPDTGQPQQMLNRYLYRHWRDHPSHTSSIRTMEERRAFLWCFLASSVISLYLKNDPLRWSSLLEGCLREIEAKPGCEGDEVLVQLIRLQLVLERVRSMRRSEDAMQVSDRPSTPMGHYTQLLQYQLKQVQDARPAHLKGSDVLDVHYHAIELAIIELGLSPRHHESTDLDALVQRKVRHACRQSTKAWFDRYLKRPPSEYLATAFTSAIQSSHCLGMLFFLSTLDDPIWTKDDVQETNALIFVDGLISHMEEANRVLGGNSHQTLTAHIRLYHSMRATWATKIAESTGEDQGPADLSSMPELDAMTFGEMLDLSFLDNDWLFAWPPDTAV